MASSMIFLFPTELEAAKLKALRPDLDIRICGIGAVETATEVARILRTERKPLLLCGIAGAYDRNLAKGDVVAVTEERFAYLSSGYDRSYLASMVVEDLPMVRSNTVSHCSMAYRAGDRDFKAIGRGSPFFKPGDEFDAKSDPAAILPNLLPAGIAIRNIRFNDDGTCSFALELPKVKVAPAELNYSLLPQVEMLEAGDALPTSFRAEMNVRYRGEPLLDEYGFCYGLKKNPTDKTGKLFRLFHRDRYDARIIDLKPGATYYVRAYAKSARGIRYSENELSVTLPAANTIVKGVTLLSESDKLIGSWHYRKWYFGMKGGFYVSANPLIAFMTLADYYRALPGLAKGKARPGARSVAAASPIYLARVHSNPSDSRPKFRLKEVEELRTYIEKLIQAAGFRQGDFESEDEAPSSKKRSSSRPATRRSAKAKAPSYGANAKWVEKCAAALKIENPEEVFVSCKTEEELKASSDKIRAWLMMSQLVLVVRQNKPPTDDQSVRWPLDIAIIDGIGEDDDEFHVVFPLGKDRSFRTPERGYVTLDKLLHRSSDAMLMFYRP